MFEWVVKILDRPEYSAKDVRKAIRLGRVTGKNAEKMIQDFVAKRMKWAMDSVREHERRFLFIPIPKETVAQIENWFREELLKKVHHKR